MNRTQQRCQPSLGDLVSWRFSQFSKSVWVCKGGSCCIWLLCLLAAGFLPSTVKAQAPLRWKFAEGMSLRYQVEQSLDWKIGVTTEKSDREPQSIGSKIDQTIDLDWRVSELLESEKARIELSVRRIQVVVAAADGTTEEFDTASDAPPRGATAMLAPLYRALIEAEISVTLASDGEMTDLQVSEELLERLKNLPGETAVDPRQLIEQLVKQLTLPLPESATEPPQSWRAREPVTLFDKTGQQAVITYEQMPSTDGDDRQVSISLSASQPAVESNQNSFQLQGTVLFDAEAGRLALSETESTAVAHETSGGKKVLKTLAQTIRVKLAGVPALEPTKASIDPPSKDAIGEDAVE